MRDDTFYTKSGIVNLHPTKGTHWAMFITEYYFDSSGCPPPRKITNQINKGIYSEYKIQKNELLRSILFICFISSKDKRS